MIKIKTNQGYDTDITVKTLKIHGEALSVLVITDQADKEAVMIYEDEVDSLIEALTKLKGELK